MPPDVLIIGGGIIGLAIADGLSRRQAAVTVLEEGQVGCQASGAAAGMLAPMSEALSPGPFLQLALDSLDRYPEWIQRLQEATGVFCGLTSSGALRVALDQAEAAELKQVKEWQRRRGAAWVPAGELREMAPQAGDQLVGAVWYPEEKHVDSPAVVRALAGVCLRQGVEILEGRRADRILVEKGRVVGVESEGERLEARTVVVAAGAWTGSLLAPLGLNMPVRPVRGQMLSLKVQGVEDFPILFSSRGYLLLKPGGHLYVGATEDQAGFDTRVNSRGLRTILGVLPELAPSFDGQPFEQTWAGLRPHTPDQRPVLGPVKQPQGLWLASGHYRNGILLAPATGEHMAAAIAGERSAESAFDPVFSPDRFTGEAEA